MSPARDWRWAAGLATAAAVLAKFTNVPLLAIVGIVAASKLQPWRRKKWPPAHLAAVLLLLMAAGIPIGCWLARNYVILGDFMGFAAKSRCLTWTAKPLSQYGNHPIFTPGGLLSFWAPWLRVFGGAIWCGTAIRWRAEEWTPFMSRRRRCSS